MVRNFGADALLGWRYAYKDVVSIRCSLRHILLTNGDIVPIFRLHANVPRKEEYPEPKPIGVRGERSIIKVRMAEQVVIPAGHEMWVPFLASTAACTSSTSKTSYVPENSGFCQTEFPM